MKISLNDYDLIILNSSGGKDSLVAIYQIYVDAINQNYPLDKIVVSHQDLGDVEWPGTKELVQKQADMFGFKTYYSKRRDKTGHEETFLEYVLRRGKWPSNAQRWCTSDFKRGPGARIVTKLTKDMGKCKILYVFGFRKDESPARSKKEVLKLNKQLTTKKRTVYDYLPIHHWSMKKVWKVIRSCKLPYHPAYDLGMPRLSCIFCIFSPFEALVIAGYQNRELLDKYIQVEEDTGHLFKKDFSLKEVRDAINNNYKPKLVKDWVM